MLALALLSASPASALLSYTLSSELKKANCANDTDSDCLDNTEEGSLAWIVSPWYFYDEDEDCSGWRNRWGLPSFHFARRDFFQVRPIGSGIRNWSSTDGTAKWVRIVYFFNYPHDCKSTVGFGGHQGDSEHIKVELYSYDLRTWYLYQAYYAHHDRDHYFSGSYLESRAQALGTPYISVAADEDSHGSWPGKEAGSSHCAGSEDDFCAGTCDCFHSTWSNDLRNGPREFVQAHSNIGGPSPETWNSSVVSVSGTTAWTDMDVGHGVNREYWSVHGPPFHRFCGWECPTHNRKADGHCVNEVHDRSNCVSPLSSKMDSSQFQLDPVLTCAGRCGGSAGSCYCDAACVSYGDCCPSACSACGYCPGTEF